MEEDREIDDEEDSLVSNDPVTTDIEFEDLLYADEEQEEIENTPRRTNHPLDVDDLDTAGKRVTTFRRRGRMADPLGNRKSVFSVRLCESVCDLSGV